MKPRVFVVVAVIAASGLVSLGPATSAAGATRTAGAGTPHVVTLITGDKVTAAPDVGGRWSLALAGSDTTVEPVTYSVFSHRDDQYLVPESAAALVQSGALDRELFNVSGLIRQGYDDARSSEVPLLVQDQPAAAPAGARVTRELAGLRLKAVNASKKDVMRFWRDLTAPGGRALAAGRKKVWLNARVRASLDVSVPQVGAPAAWQAGYTGKGVTVAVLDTGIDATHPDLAGKVVRDRNFVGGDDTVDRAGHGTHVASTITGAGGRYRGVAPDARLAVGKVLDDEGIGQMDGIIAGMVWASSEVKAKVVNMSLGGGPTDGTDPVSQAANTLSRDNGTLFVVAAGNAGRDESVGTPAAADAALAVGNVSKSDEPAGSSSRGPRVRDGAVKPEIAAPGEDIVAALAGGATFPPGQVVDQHHVRLSGTSMAAPHVAGGAAILAGQHPDWSSEQLKAALVGSAAPVGGGVFAVGAGRLDLARATAQRVHATPATVNGYLAWGETGTQQHSVSYRNTGTDAVTLGLTLDMTGADGEPAPTGTATLPASSVTVPAGGVATVQVTLRRNGNPGRYSGVLVASTADGVSRVRTPVSAHVEQEMYDLTVNLLNRDGAVADLEHGKIEILGVDDRNFIREVASGTRMRVPAGRYMLVGLVQTPQQGKDPSYAAVAHPELRLTGNTELTLDARVTRRVTVSTDKPAVRGGVWVSQTSTHRGGGTDDPFTVMTRLDPRFAEYYSGSTPGVAAPTFGSGNTLRLTEPTLELFAEATPRTEVWAQWLSDPGPEGSRRLDLAHGGAGSPAELAGARGKLVVLEPPADMDYDELTKRIANVRDAGGVAVAVRDSSPRAGHRGGDPLALPTVTIAGAAAGRFADLARNSGQATLTVRASAGTAYQLSFPESQRVPDNLTYSVKTADLTEVTFADYGMTAGNSSAWISRHWDSGLWFSTADAVGHSAAEHVEYYSPGEWSFTTFGNGMVTRRSTEQLAGGREHRVAWNQAVSGPAFPGTGTPWVFRYRNQMDITIPLFTDAGGHPMVADHEGIIDTGSTRLYRDGTLFGLQNLAGRGTFTVPGEDACYRLVTDVTRKQSWWPLSTKVSAEWTFRSGFRTSETALPLLSVQYTPTVDLRNTAPGRVDFTIPVTVTRQDGPAQVTSLAVDVSYDDGRTWRKAAVAGTGSDWTASVRHPARGFASLRAKAADVAGNTTTQTVIRAYRIGG